MQILAINTGSSSIKFALYERNSASADLQSTLSGLIEGLEPQGQGHMKWQDRQGQKTEQALGLGAGTDTHAVALAALQQLLQTQGVDHLDAIAHRIVHGGSAYTHSVVLSEAILHELEALNVLAPLHQPHNIAGVRSFMQQFAGVPQIGCFDTAFHASMPALHRQLALPASLSAAGIRRYGFHGLSYQYISAALLQASPRATGKVLMAHLGSGASLCVMTGGKSQDTSMSFSALDGLMMSSRCGSLDPGVILYLLGQGWEGKQLEQLLYKESGLLGVSGLSGDMRTLRKASQASSNDAAAAAQNAIALFEHRIVQEIGKLVATVGGLDVLAFSGGIGENDVQTRLNVCQRLQFLGVQIDPVLNLQAVGGNGARKISHSSSAVEVWVVPTDEGSVAAHEALALLPVA